MARTTPSRSLAAVVLAAGKGKRLKSRAPKVLHPICGRPALWWALRNVKAARPTAGCIHMFVEPAQLAAERHEAPGARMADRPPPMGVTMAGSEKHDKRLANAWASAVNRAEQPRACR